MAEKNQPRKPKQKDMRPPSIQAQARIARCLTIMDRQFDNLKKLARARSAKVTKVQVEFVNRFLTERMDQMQRALDDALSGKSAVRREEILVPV